MDKELLKLLDEKFDKLINTMSNTFFTKDDYGNRTYVKKI